MSESFNVCILGATGVVGSKILEVLYEKKFPIKELYLLSSVKSAGKKIKFKEQEFVVIDVEKFDWSKADIGLFSAGGDVSKKYVPKAVKHGCVVIDNTSAFRNDDDIPLVVPEVNSEDIKHYVNRGIIANPNCSTIQMVVALKPIHDYAKIKHINVCTYQSVSGSGINAIQELQQQTKDIVAGKEVVASVYPKQIAFNVLPHIDTFQANGYTREEMKMVWETQKIMDKNIMVNSTTVRVPVITAHSESVTIETEKKITANEVCSLLKNAPGVTLMDGQNDGEYPTAIDVVDNDSVFVGRIREDISRGNSMNLWIVTDNIRKGAATNSVQIAESLISDYKI